MVELTGIPYTEIILPHCFHNSLFCCRLDWHQRVYSRYDLAGLALMIVQQRDVGYGVIFCGAFRGPSGTYVPRRFYPSTQPALPS